MQEENNNIFIKMIDRYMEDNVPLMEYEIRDVDEKKEIVYDEFNISSIKLKDCSVVEKIYLGFYILTVKNKDLDTIGARLVFHDFNTYQVSSFIKKEKNGSFSFTEEYRIKDCESCMSVAVKKVPNQEEEIYAITSKTTGLTCLELKELVIAEMQKKLANILDSSDIKIYQINRKRKAN